MAAFSHVEVHRVVDRGFRAKGVLLFEILLHMRRLVLEVEARLNAICDDTRAIAKGRRRGGAREAQWKQQAHAVGSSQVKILADDRFKEVAVLHRAIKDLGQTDFELTDREAVIAAGRAFLAGHRPGQAMRPAVEEGLDVGWTEGITRGLERGRVGTR
jgi:hypothetical protein